MRYVFWSLLLLAGVALVKPAGALTGEQVLIVANEKSPESLALARHYAQMRNIPTENLIALPLSTDFSISRENYGKQIRDPLKKYLFETQLGVKIRCIVLMRDVPVKVHGPSSVRPEHFNLYKLSGTRAHGRLAMVYQLLPTVAKRFPPPQTNGLKPLGKLFDVSGMTIKEPFPPLDDLMTDIQWLFEQKLKEVKNLQAPEERTIAWRQMLSIQNELYGLRGVIDLMQESLPPESPQLAGLKKQLQEKETRLAEFEGGKLSADQVNERLDLIEEVGGSQMLIQFLRETGIPLNNEQTQVDLIQKTLDAQDATVDSELALLWWPTYSLVGPFTNPLNLRMRDRFQGSRIPLPLMTARIDGPSFEIARRIVDDSVAVEKNGLSGIFYIDAGGKVPEWDQYLKQLYARVKEGTSLPAIIDELPSLFQPNSCPDAALYVGWYSLQRYIPAFSWKRGAVAVHIASFEAQHLRDPGSDEWCVRLLQNGVAATFGAINEPLLGTFPNPDDFFSLLLTGKFTLAECYWLTTPAASWRFTLIGDPLYNPFAANPQLDWKNLPSELRLVGPTSQTTAPDTPSDHAPEPATTRTSEP